MEELPSGDELRRLAFKWKNGTLSEEEERLLAGWDEQQRDELLRLPDDSGGPEVVKERMYTNLMKTVREDGFDQKPVMHRLWVRIAVAASILIVLSAGAYFLTHKQASQQVAQNHPVDIKPGSKKAILQLANGQKIALNEAPAGKLAQQGSTTVTKTADGQVNYSAQKLSGTTEDIYNTITTQRGGYYPLKMADGTIAVLDAQSSIKYPVTFNGKERRVEITGQVYFMVAHNAAKPFKVMVKDQVIEDIGTEFNINAYDDEPELRTTLVGGSVRVSKRSQSAILVPGQQASTLPESDNIKIKQVDIEDVIAWKNGKTSFKNENIQEIMRQVSRWYDVDIIYQGNIPDRKFMGGIDRNAKFSDFLKILEFNNIHYTINGKTITVKPQ